MTISSPSTLGSTATRMSSSAAGRLRRERDAAVLRLSALCDVELREHLQARRDGHREPLRDPLHLVEDAVDAEPDDERVLLRVEVDVRGAVLGRLEDDRVHEPDERRVGDAVVGLEVVLVVVLLLDLELVLDERRALPRLALANLAPELDLDVLARRDPDLERVTRREAELVDRLDVRRVGDRDLQDVALEGVRECDRTLEHVDRNLVERRSCRSPPPPGRRTACGASRRARAPGRSRARRLRRREPSRASRCPRASGPGPAGQGRSARSSRGGRRRAR